ncbi:MAG TPA: peptidylprolyl isomerase [Myxococcota bacterium]|nr:peptidylprolyl isomerase [Myxococcota bacterium]
MFVKRILAVICVGTWLAAASYADANKMAGLAAIQRYIDAQKIDKTKPGWKIHLPKPPPDVDFKGVKVTWKLQTNVGDMSIRLMPEVAPMHVTSTVYLTRLGYYDDTPFHRVIKGFMAQGGDPTGTGRGGPGYQYATEIDPKAKHDKRGIVSMAHAGPNTEGSQFFITFGPTPSLDGGYSVFGEVVSGMDTLAKMEEKANTADGPPTAPLKIVKATIEVD